MKPRLLLFCAITLALAAGGCWYIYKTLYPGPSASAATATAAPQPGVQTINGETVVTVSPAVQKASHIEVAPLALATVQPDSTAWATVVDLQPLFDLSNRLAAARADLGTLTAQAGNSHTQYERSNVLFQDDRNVSQKTLQDARAVMQADQAKLKSATAAVSGLEATMRQQFGDVLASASMSPGSDLFQRLQSGRMVVLRVTLPVGFRGAAPARITADAPDGQVVAATKLSVSPLADPSVQGIPWFYAADRALPVGTRTSAHVPTPVPASQMLVIPDAAVVWYGGQQWAYVQTAQDHFTRRYVPASNEGDRGLLVTSGFHAGDRVVTQGAQLLLSEEQKPQGIATACKDPPECDD
ncbi:Metal ion efflux membrane fusion protein family [Paraburkholderia piptadeniae]|uniref:Metal ion efflux membrane fusion protein family n=1 Tax=Paraburkholderia piptadeniae TaxID=1701573 RepID=A0A1N7SEA8_9BURK|nr:metal transporter [Paraburkholderia piptadeniae]SIT45701.1 Metal ion efflux membrane fusion protein family [Paraburkholderia piptadeniae]